MYSLFKMYIYSFVFVAVLGMIQDVLFKFLHINFYMSNGLNNYDRIHGFCYETSYYSTYLLPAWCMLAYMYEKRCTIIIGMKKIKIFLMMITLVLILSFSRMGFLMMFVYLLSRLMANSAFGVKRTRTSFSIYLNKRSLKITGVVLLILGSLFVIFYICIIFNFQNCKIW